MKAQLRSGTKARRLPAAVLALLLGWPALAAQKDAAANQTRFATPEEAVEALAHAAKAKDQTALTAIFGPDRAKLLTGDPVQDNNALERFGANLEKSHRLEKVSDTRFTVLVGADDWPSPIPIVRDGSQWRFDTAAGLEEILNRHIGEDELSAILTCRAYVLAQWEYYTRANGTAQDGLAVYAQKFVSAPGKRDGLYWETRPGAKPSPLGRLVAQARSEGYAGRPGPPRRNAPASVSWILLQDTHTPRRTCAGREVQLCDQWQHDRRVRPDSLSR